MDRAPLLVPDSRSTKHPPGHQTSPNGDPHWNWLSAMEDIKVEHLNPLFFLHGILGPSLRDLLKDYRRHESCWYVFPGVLYSRLVDMDLSNGLWFAVTACAFRSRIQSKQLHCPNREALQQLEQSHHCYKVQIPCLPPLSPSAAAMIKVASSNKPPLQAMAMAHNVFSSLSSGKVKNIHIEANKPHFPFPVKIFPKKINSNWTKLSQQPPTTHESPNFH